MTALAEEYVAAVESLEFGVLCTMGRHVGSPARADYWLNAHGCRERLACAPCVTRWRKEFAGLLDRAVHVGCPDCGQSFTSYDEFVTEEVRL